MPCAFQFKKYCINSLAVPASDPCPGGYACAFTNHTSAPSVSQVMSISSDVVDRYLWVQQVLQLQTVLFTATDTKLMQGTWDESASAAGTGVMQDSDSYPGSTHTHSSAQMASIIFSAD